MSGHQYDQQVNQVKVSREPRKWYNNGDDSNLFGFEPNFGCCTANYHQGWPKFVSHLWYATNDGGLSAVSYAPCTVRTALGGVPVRLKVSGGYPFAQTVRIEVAVKQPTEFPLYLRVPYWARQPMIYLPDGEIMQVRANETTCVRRKWRTGDVVRLEMPAAPKLTRWYHQSGAVEFGPAADGLPAEGKLAQARKRRLAGDHGRPVELALLRDEPMKAVAEGERETAFGKGAPCVKVLAKARAGGMGDGRRERRQRADGADAAGPRAGDRADALRRHRAAHRTVPHCRRNPPTIKNKETAPDGFRRSARQKLQENARGQKPSRALVYQESRKAHTQPNPGERERAAALSQENRARREG